MERLSKSVNIKKEDLEPLFDSEPGSIFYEHGLKVEKLQDILSKFGLTTNQSKIYIYLGKFGSKTAPEISKATGTARTETYQILNVLQHQGIVSIKLSSPTRFSIVPIENALSVLVDNEREEINLLAKQERKVIELWNDIPSFTIEEKEEGTEKLQMLQGIAKIQNRMKTMIYDCKKEFLMLATEKDIARFYHADFFEILDSSTIKAKFIICPAKKIPDFIEEVDKTMTRVLPHSESDSTCFIIIDSKEVLLFTKNASYPSDDISAIWTNSNSVLGSIRMLFNCLWDKAEIRY